MPVKRLGVAKTRLYAAGRPRPEHEALALALATDTVAAALAAADRVVVVTDDPAAAPAVRRLGALVVADEPDAGLNAALAYGAGRARVLAPADGVAALSSDLPALRPAELAAALAAVGGRGFVADAAGTGTTLLAAAPGAELRPRFGRGSAAAHAADGATPLTGPWPTLRRDVDTPADLAEAATLGLGPATLTWTTAHAPVA